MLINFAYFLVGPDLGPICLQRLSADDTRKQRVTCECPAIHRALISIYWSESSSISILNLCSKGFGKLYKVPFLYRLPQFLFNFANFVLFVVLF